ncbi:MAG TPA: HAMP domain-containing sensor histidine kinase [Nitrospirae bacterium]|nr:HAMP domain-containing sensor histidine kinase [Nitrospirota bacterium]HDZ01514.1 HAMP domain-containing sensor histidine kinase [Nitrospirota bacterium]
MRKTGLFQESDMLVICPACMLYSNMINSLKFKITITAFLIISIIMTISTLRDIKKSERQLLEVQMEKAVLLSERIAHGVMVLMLNNRWQDLQSFMESLTRDSKELKGIRIFRPESGVIVASSSPKEIGAKTYGSDIEMFQKQKTENAFLSEKNGRKYASNFTTIRNQPVCYRCHGSEKEILGILGVDISLSDVYKSVEEFKREHVQDTLIGFLLIGGGFLLVVGLLIDRPIRRMIRIIRRIEDGDLSARMEEGKKDEFGLVAKSFNSMLESLESAKKEIEVCHSEQMQRAAKLATLGEIVSGIAHEIKNPLTGISCAVQVIQSEMSEDDGRREVTAEILNHIKRLDRTVKDLLNYAKPKPPHFLPLKINDILDKAVFFVYPEAKKHNVVIDAEIDGEIPDVMMDSDQMQQVFLNLMINAVQAMPDGGTLKITTSKSVKDGKTAEERTEVIMRFEDTGKGMESDCMESIFEPFFTKKSKGTGLGLAISRRIVQEHGGDITVESEVGKGSVFTLYLPVMKAS